VKYYPHVKYRRKNMFLSNFFSKLFQHEEKMEYITGKAASFEDVCLSDLEKYPIWVFAIDHEEDYEEGQDGSWIAPITNSTDVGEELYDAYILLRVKENNCPVLAHFGDMLLDDLSYWDFADEDWKEFRSLDVPSSIHLVSIPSILGQVAVEFLVSEDKDSARVYKHTIL